MSLRETIESDRTMQDAKSEFSLFGNEHYRLLEVFERQFAHLGRNEGNPRISKGNYLPSAKRKNHRHQPRARAQAESRRQVASQ